MLPSFGVSQESVLDLLDCRDGDVTLLAVDVPPRQSRVGRSQRSHPLHTEGRPHSGSDGTRRHGKNAKTTGDQRSTSIGRKYLRPLSQATFLVI
jgi:hypothetical protein